MAYRQGAYLSGTILSLALIGAMAMTAAPAQAQKRAEPR